MTNVCIDNVITYRYNPIVTRYQWNKNKNAWLQIHRNITFEKIVVSIKNHKLIATITHTT